MGKKRGTEKKVGKKCEHGGQKREKVGKKKREEKVKKLRRKEEKGTKE